MARIKRPRYVQFTVKTLYELKPVSRVRIPLSPLSSQSQSCLRCFVKKDLVSRRARRSS